ncbi:copper homeostasis protein CutC [Vibrio splendidus]|uniref:PF03932 family protein CutC n=1 Tax=Vibrio splendidus 12E03 TaxID=1191305 RepID=A0A1E5FSI5_VIBSP|nr:copper homeostasis protein CutC [Vibrio splendidus]OEF93487.1 copper homeostasis protein CutC [Vibrio splendidus 12E03]
MGIQVEASVGNIESLHSAITGGATRIELCSALALGGLTPCFGTMKVAARISSIPVYALIRPRQGDFLYSEEEIQIMLYSIKAAKEAALQGVVLGALDAEGNIDMISSRRLCDYAHKLGLGVTYHRAFDQCNNAKKALEDIIELGCERILTSGLASSAQEGIEVLEELVEQAGERISIMPGAGVNTGNAKQILDKTNAFELHLSGKTTRSSKMKFIAEQSKMGSADVDDYQLPVTDQETISAVLRLVNDSDEINHD